MSGRRAGSRLLADRTFWLAAAMAPFVLLVAGGTGLVKLGLPNKLAAIAPAKLALVVLAYPLVEEWLFRGRLQPALADRWKGMALPGLSTANVLTSLAFALAHLIAQPPVYALATLVPSLVYGHLRERYGSIVPSFILHAWYNLSWLALVRA